MNNAAISTYRFRPNGADHEFQQLVTNLLHQIVMDDERVTLGELGYLHQNTLMLNQDTQCPELRIYFDARFVYRKAMNPTIGREDLIVVDEMSIFKDWLFVGHPQGVFTIEKILAPKTELFEDELGRTSLRIKKGNRQVETVAAIMRCNASIAIAAALNINLGDPNFKIQFNPVAKGSNSAVDSIVVSASNRMVPVAFTVTHSARTSVTADNCYDPDLAVPYLMEIAEAVQNSEASRSDMIKKVRSDGKKNKRKNQQKVHKGFGKFA